MNHWVDADVEDLHAKHHRDQHGQDDQIGTTVASMVFKGKY